MVINTYTDNILQEVCQSLEITIPNYDPENDPVKQRQSSHLEWSIPFPSVKSVEQSYNKHLKMLSSKSKSKSKRPKIQHSENNEIL